MLDWVMLAVGLLLTIGTGLFVASEFALVNLDRADLEARQARGERGLATTIRALKRTATHLSSAQLGITLTTLLTGYTIEPAMSRLLAGPLAAISVPEAWIRPVGTVVAIAFATLLSMIIGELAPKNLALAMPELTARLVSPFQIAFTTVFGAVVHVLNGFSNGLLRRFGIEPKEELSSARTAEELASLVRRSAMEGSLEASTATLLTKAIDFAEYTAEDVMTPRTRLVTLEADDTAATVVGLARRSGHSRFPVIGDDADDVLGLVHVKQAVAVPRERRAQVAVSEFMSEALMVPASLPLDHLLGQLRGRGLQMAVLLDEYGGTAGVVTLEDLVEELVGEVADEHDARVADVRLLDDGSWLIAARLRPDEVGERMGLSVPDDEDYDTMGGFVMAELGRVPEPGDEVRLPTGTLVVDLMDGLRVERLRYLPDPEEPGEGGGDDAGAARLLEEPADPGDEATRAQRAADDV